MGCLIVALYSQIPIPTEGGQIKIQFPYAEPTPSETLWIDSLVHESEKTIGYLTETPEDSQKLLAQWLKDFEDRLFEAYKANEIRWQKDIVYRRQMIILMGQPFNGRIEIESKPETGIRFTLKYHEHSGNSCYEKFIGSVTDYSVGYTYCRKSPEATVVFHDTCEVETTINLPKGGVVSIVLNRTKCTIEVK